MRNVGQQTAEVHPEDTTGEIGAPQTRTDREAANANDPVARCIPLHGARFPRHPPVAYHEMEGGGREPDGAEPAQTRVYA